MIVFVSVFRGAKSEEKTVRCKAYGFSYGARWHAWCVFQNVTFDQDTKLNIERIGLPEATDEDFDRIRFSSSSVSLVHPDLVAKFPNIEVISLDFYGTKLNGLNPYKIENCENITHLALDLKDFVAISSNIFNDCEKLEMLEIRSDSLTDLPDGLFKNQINLRSLELEGKNLKLRVSSFEGLKNLTQLSLWSMDLSHTEENFFQSLKIRRLDYEGNPNHELTFVDLPNVESINLSNNKIVELPANAFKGCPRLTFLYLDSNPIKALRGDEFVQLSGLKALFLWNTYLASIAPTTFHPLTSLERLYLSQSFAGQNNIISKELFMYSINLRQLELSHNNIEAIHPEAFNNLNNLTRLELRGNKCVDENISSPSGEVLNMTLVKKKLKRCFKYFPNQNKKGL